MLRKNVLALAILFFVSISSLHAQEKYMLDVSHTLVGFGVKHMVITTVNGKFNDFSGTIVYDENDLSKLKVEVVIKTASIDTDNLKRDNHLRSPDFFDAENYPEITFVSKKVIKKGDQNVLVGDLAIRGVAKEVEIPFKITGKIVDPWGNTRLGLEGSLTINRQEFGVKWNKKMDAGGWVVGDDVKITLQVEAIQTKG